MHPLFIVNAFDKMWQPRHNVSKCFITVKDKLPHLSLSTNYFQLARYRKGWQLPAWEWDIADTRH